MILMMGICSSISEDGKTVVYAKLKDDGYQITEDLFLFDLKNSTTVSCKIKIEKSE